MLFRQVVGHLFNIHIGGLGLLGIYHADAVVPFHRAGVSRYLVGVKYQNQLAPAVALVVAQQLDQPGTGAVQVLPGQLLQLLPGKNDVVPVHQQVFRPFREGGGRRRLLGNGGLFAEIGIFEFAGPRRLMGP